MILACTGGGILVPIFINGIPVPLAQDSYPIAIFTSFLLHLYFPIMREVLELSPVFKVSTLDRFALFVGGNLSSTYVAKCLSFDFL